jgi:hypothetical protein
MRDIKLYTIYIRHLKDIRSEDFGRKSWAEARREEEEDLTSARGFYKSAKS